MDSTFISAYVSLQQELHRRKRAYLAPCPRTDNFPQVLRWLAQHAIDNQLVRLDSMGFTDPMLDPFHSFSRADLVHIRRAVNAARKNHKDMNRGPLDNNDRPMHIPPGSVSGGYIFLDGPDEPNKSGMIRLYEREGAEPRYSFWVQGVVMKVFMP